MIHKYLLIEILHFLDINNIIKYSLINKESYNFVMNYKFTLNKSDYIKKLMLGIQTKYNFNVAGILKQNTINLLIKKYFLLT